MVVECVDGECVDGGGLLFQEEEQVFCRVKRRE